jgi:hypothetical protein
VEDDAEKAWPDFALRAQGGCGSEEKHWTSTGKAPEGTAPVDTAMAAILQLLQLLQLQRLPLDILARGRTLGTAALGDSRSSADVPPDLRKGLDSVPAGQLTAPETTKVGIEMFAVCAKAPSKTDNATGKRQALESLFAEKFEQVSKRYLQELRRSALIEQRFSGLAAMWQSPR